MSEVSGNNPKYVNASTQTRKTKMPDLAIQLSPIPTKIPKFRSVAQDELMEKVLEKKDHQALLKQKKQIQNLIDFQSPRIVLTEFPHTDYSRNKKISINFQLITLDDEPINELMLCKKCKQVRARGHMTSSTVVRHLKQHQQVDIAHKIVPKKRCSKNQNGLKYAASLSQAMKTTCPIPVDAQEYAKNLPRGYKQTIEKTIGTQGDSEAQMTFRKNLNRTLSNRICFEMSEKKKEQLLHELRSNERAYSPELYPKNVYHTRDNTFPSKVSLKEKETTQSKQANLSVSDTPIMPESLPVSDQNNTCSSNPSVSQSANLRPAERLEEAGLEIQSIEPAGNGVSISSSSPIEETEIKVEIPNA